MNKLERVWMLYLTVAVVVLIGIVVTLSNTIATNAEILEALHFDYYN